jgi:hypothetical protein
MLEDRAEARRTTAYLVRRANCSGDAQCVPEGEEMSGRGKFVHEEIEVEFAERPGPPVSIAW